MTETLAQLSIAVGVGAMLALAMQSLRQPLVIAYLLTGIIVGPAFLNVVRPDATIDAFGKLGVSLLLFMVGLGLKPKIIRDVGAIAIITGLGQIIFTAALGVLLAGALGYGPVTSFYLAIAFTFSSTIIVVQILYSKEEQDTLYGRIAIGFLLVQDFVAMIALLLITSAEVGSTIAETLTFTVIKATIIGIAAFVLSREIVPRIDNRFAAHRELLLLFALAMCLGMGALFVALDLSLELGALVAGLLLSVSPYHRDIASRLSPLRDFFLVIFFIMLGTHVSYAAVASNLPLIVGFSLFILIGNPLVVIVLMKRFGYTLETSFYAGLTVAQISEFSLILLTTASSLGYIANNLIGPATIIGLITICISSYWMMHSHRLFEWLQPTLRTILGPDSTTDARPISQSVDVILFGCHRLGGGIADALRDMRLKYLIVDYDPEVIKALKASGHAAVFGSADDPTFLDSLPLTRARTIISTIPEITTNRVLLTQIRKVNKRGVVLCVANHQPHAAELYRRGASYVIVPPYLGRRYLIELLKANRLDPRGYRAERKLHERELSFLQNSEPPASIPY